MGDLRAIPPTKLRLNWFAISVVLLAATSQASSERQPKPMTNEDVIQLVKLGVDDEAMAGMIAKRPTAFALGAQDLQRLRSSGVSEATVHAMLETSQKGTLRVVTEPVGVTVLVAGQNVGVTPYEGTLAPGEYVVKLEKYGYSTEEWSCTLVAGAETALSVELQSWELAQRVGAKPAEPTRAEQREEVVDGKGSKLPLVLAGVAAAGATAFVVATRAGGGPVTFSGNLAPDDDLAGGADDRRHQIEVQNSGVMHAQLSVANPRAGGVEMGLFRGSCGSTLRACESLQWVNSVGSMGLLSYQVVPGTYMLVLDNEAPFPTSYTLTVTLP